MMRALLATTWVALAAIGCASPIVGAECKDGYVVCGGQCVRLDNNFMHCGSCNNECSAVQVCLAGECVANTERDGGDLDASVPDAGGSGGSGGTSGTGGTSGDGGSGGVIVIPDDAGFPGCRIGEIDCSGTCVTPNDDPSHCGGCGTVCATDQFCVAGVCMDQCEDPFTLCPSAGRCVDLSNDARNCGICGRRCKSGICEMGVCQDAVPGHLIVIGHDYTSSNATMENLARSSVFLARGAPVPALAFHGSAPAVTVARIDAVIEASLERQWQPDVVTNPALLEIFLREANDYRLLVIYPQAGETDMNLLEKLRDVWLSKLADFMRRGGVVVLFEHDPADLNGGVRNGGTHQILSCQRPTPGIACATSLFSATEVTRVTAGDRIAIDYGDGWITNGVPAAYSAALRTVRFGGVSTPGNFVAVHETSGEPVIVHRLVSAESEP